MYWIDRAEAKFGHFAIPGLLRYVAGFNALCFVLIKLNPHFIEFLYLNPELVLKGEVWRLLTYIFIPPRFGGIFPDWLGAAMYILYFIWIGDGLEQAMGEFRLTLFYVLGMLGTTVGAFIANADPSGFLLNTSLLFAFARYYPDTTIYFFLVLPVKVKWMAWLSAAMVVLGFLGGTWGYRGAVFAAMANFFVFFGRDIFQEAQHRQQVTGRRRRFEKETSSAGEALHTCVICGRTELSAPDLDFRVAKDGEEYCIEHLPKAVLPAA